MSTLLELRADVRDLIGPSLYDKFFLPGGETTWVDEGLNWACDETASLLGLTRVDAMVAVSSKYSIIPEDAIKVVAVQRR